MGNFVAGSATAFEPFIYRQADKGEAELPSSSRASPCHLYTSRELPRGVNSLYAAIPFWRPRIPR